MSSPLSSRSVLGSTNVVFQSTMATFVESTIAQKDGTATWILSGFAHDEHDLNKNFMIILAVAVFSTTVEVGHVSANGFWLYLRSLRLRLKIGIRRTGTLCTSWFC